MIVLFIVAIIIHRRDKNFFICYPTQLYFVPIVLLLLVVYFRYRGGASLQRQMSSIKFIYPIIIGFYIIIICFEWPGFLFLHRSKATNVVDFSIEKCNRKDESMQLKIYNDFDKKYIFIDMDEKVCENPGDFKIQASCAKYLFGAYVVGSYDVGNSNQGIADVNEYSNIHQDIMLRDSLFGICLSGLDEVESTKSNLIIGVETNGIRKTIEVKDNDRVLPDLGSYVKFAKNGSANRDEIVIPNPAIFTRYMMFGEINAELNDRIVACDKTIRLEVFQGNRNSVYMFEGRHYFVELEKESDATLVFSSTGYKTKKLYLSRMNHSENYIFSANCVFEEGTDTTERAMNLSDYIE